MTGLLASLGVATALGFATPAHADSANNDATFLGALRQAGITYSDPGQVIAAGRGVCGMMADGAQGMQVANEIANRNPGFTLDGAALFTRLAATAYCPQHLA
ncbi:MAG: DUF732 domain-containing protein [Mycobacteriaceae bacterium]|nr:DUF732 domain-containing protein [Mycobacteriaceae bacterium]